MANYRRTGGTGGYMKGPVNRPGNRGGGGGGGGRQPHCYDLQQTCINYGGCCGTMGQGGGCNVGGIMGCCPAGSSQCASSLPGNPRRLRRPGGRSNPGGSYGRAATRMRRGGRIRRGRR